MVDDAQVLARVGQALWPWCEANSDLVRRLASLYGRTRGPSRSPGDRLWRAVVAAGGGADVDAARTLVANAARPVLPADVLAVVSSPWTESRLEGVPEELEVRSALGMSRLDFAVLTLAVTVARRSAAASSSSDFAMSATSSDEDAVGDEDADPKPAAAAAAPAASSEGSPPALAADKRKSARGANWPPQILPAAGRAERERIYAALWPWCRENAEACRRLFNMSKGKRARVGASFGERLWAAVSHDAESVAYLRRLVPPTVPAEVHAMLGVDWITERMVGVPSESTVLETLGIKLEDLKLYTLAIMASRVDPNLPKRELGATDLQSPDASPAVTTSPAPAPPPPISTPVSAPATSKRTPSLRAQPSPKVLPAQPPAQSEEKQHPDLDEDYIQQEPVRKKRARAQTQASQAAAAAVAVATPTPAEASPVSQAPQAAVKQSPLQPGTGKGSRSSLPLKLEGSAEVEGEKPRRKKHRVSVNAVQPATTQPVHQTASQHALTSLSHAGQQNVPQADSQRPAVLPAAVAEEEEIDQRYPGIMGPEEVGKTLADMGVLFTKLQRHVTESITELQESNAFLTGRVLHLTKKCNSLRRKVQTLTAPPED